MIRLVPVLLTALCTVTPKLIIEDGYYWKDYNHKIPEDAVPCGKDNAGSPIYVGQVLFEGKLIPGKLYSNGSDIYFHWGPQRADKNIKILCSLFPAQFEWIWTNLNDVSKLTEKVLVVGGFEPEMFTYVGRLHTGDETTCGKVICKPTNCIGFFYVLHDNAYRYDGEFEILAYKFGQD